MIQPFEAVRAIPHLRAVDDELERRVRIDERVAQPRELLRAEHRLAGLVVHAVGRAVPAIVEQEQVDVAPARTPEDARSVGQSVARIRPVTPEQRERFAFHHVRHVGVVRPVIVVVPDRELRRRDQQSLQRRQRALPAIARCHRSRIEFVRRLEIQVVAHPHHQVGRLGGDGVEDLIAAAIGAGVPRRLGGRQEEARADRDRDVVRVVAASSRAVRATRPRAGRRRRRSCTSRALPARVPSAATRTTSSSLARRVERQCVVASVVLGAPVNADRTRRFGLHPDERARVIRVAMHDDEPRFALRSRQSHATDAPR